MILGAIIGDVIGSQYEFHRVGSKEFPLFSSDASYTDDTALTIAAMDSLLNNKDVVACYRYYGTHYAIHHYGRRFAEWLQEDNPKPYNSCGNGSAMRVSGVGWMANTEEEVRELSKKVTECTHNHEEGLLGAEVTAMCIYYARKGKSKEFIRKYAEQYYSLDFNYEELKKTYFNAPIICQYTVPVAIYCFLMSTDFIDCLRIAISLGGDTDTTAAIACSIAEPFYGIPDYLKEEVLKYLPEEFIGVLEAFSKKYERNA